MKECCNHDLLTPYPVYTEKAGEFVAQFKATVAVLPKSTVVLAGAIEFAKSRYESEFKIENKEVLEVLAKDLWKKEVVKKEPKEAKEDKK